MDDRISRCLNDYLAYFFRVSMCQINKQIKLNFFSEYTKRYEDIISNFPENINEESFSYENLASEKKDKTMRYMRIYFDLCSEEFFLREKDRIEKYVWDEWEEGMSSAFKKKAFKEAWAKILKDTYFGDKFKDFVNLKMKS